MPKPTGGFDPSRLVPHPRPAGIVQSILAPTTVPSRGIAEIRALGVGGAGGNAVNRLLTEQVQGIDCIAINTDVQALGQSLASRTLRIGASITGGLGAGGDYDRGRRAAEEAEEALAEIVAGADMVFVTAGMGGGTGTGASPVVARVAKAAGALTVAVITRPFRFEGARRKVTSDVGIRELANVADALIIIPNDRLLGLATRRDALTGMFKLADDVMLQGIRGITDLIVTTGLINVDFADVRAVMEGGGMAMMGTGTGHGDRRAEDAAHQAITSPMLESAVSGARAVLLNITGGPDLTLHDVNQAAELVAHAVDPEANIIFGAFIHPKMADSMKITLIATGLSEPSVRR